jgi:hypothetical protein
MTPNQQQAAAIRSFYVEMSQPSWGYIEVPGVGREMELCISFKCLTLSQAERKGGSRSRLTKYIQQLLGN